MANSRQERKALTRARILRAAGALFRRQGFENAKTTDLARRVGVSHGTIFAHFDSKASILRALVIRQMNNDLILLRNLQFENRSARDKIKGLASALWDLTRRDPELAAAYCSQSWVWSPADEEQYQLLLQEILKIARQIIHSGMENGEIVESVDLEFTLDLLQAKYLDNLRKTPYQPQEEGLQGELTRSELLAQFGYLVDRLLPSPELRTSDYPHQEQTRLQA